MPDTPDILQAKQNQTLYSQVRKACMWMTCFASKPPNLKTDVIGNN